MATEAFRRRIMDVLLPEFCHDPGRRHDPAGFRGNIGKVCDRDAENFLRALDAGLVTQRKNTAGKMNYYAPRSRVGEQFFWTGGKGVTPGPLTLWVEPIIAIATLGVLHFEHGWPEALLGLQSIDWAFDIVAYPDAVAESEHIACEIKKDRREVDDLLEGMRRFASRPSLEPSSTGSERNAYKKVLALRARRAPFFWAMGPDGYDAAFRLAYLDGGRIVFHQVLSEHLRYPAPVG